MTHDQIKKLIGKKVKVYFKEHDTRLPMIGKFIELEDCEELLKRGWIRFVHLSNQEFFDSAMNKINFTKMYKFNDFHSTKEVLETISNG